MNIGKIVDIIVTIISVLFLIWIGLSALEVGFRDPFAENYQYSWWNFWCLVMGV